MSLKTKVIAQIERIYGLQNSIREQVLEMKRMEVSVMQLLLFPKYKYTNCLLILISGSGLSLKRKSSSSFADSAHLRQKPK